jgi:hypothetical protein
MAKRILFRCDICNRPRRADVVVGPQPQPQDHASTPNVLQYHQLDRFLVCHCESPANVVRATLMVLSRSGQLLLVFCDLVFVLGGASVPHATDSVL